MNATILIVGSGSLARELMGFDFEQNGSPVETVLRAVSQFHQCIGRIVSTDDAFAGIRTAVTVGAPRITSTFTPPTVSFAGSGCCASALTAEL